MQHMDNVDVSWQSLRRHGYDLVDECDVIRRLDAIRRRRPGLMNEGLARGVTTFMIRPFQHEGFMRIVGADWQDIVAVYIDQIAKNQHVLRQAEAWTEDLITPVLHNDSDTGFQDKFRQLPCTRATALARVELAKERVAYDAPVLVLGDDDGVSIELAKAGFSNIQVVDIDPHILARIQQQARTYDLNIRCLQHDLSKPLSSSLHTDFALIMMDPPCSYEGVSMFLEAAYQINDRRWPQAMMLTTNLMSQLPSGVAQFNAYLRRRQLAVQAFLPGHSTYPLPAGRRHFLNAAIAVAGLLTGNWRILRSKRWRLHFFVSDMLMLCPQGDRRDVS